MKTISPWFQTAALMTQSVMRSAIWKPHGRTDRPTANRSVRIERLIPQACRTGKDHDMS